MAKPARGGLGRGLSSLMGGTTGAIPPVERTTNRERVEYEENIDYSVENIQHVSRETSPIESEVKEIEPSPIVEKIEEKVEEIIENQDIGEVDIDKISPNPDQPRTNFKEEDLDELTRSIERDGLLQPILVRVMPDGNYQIIAGERRWQASKRAGKKTVPVTIKEVSDDKALELALIENIQRNDLNPIEEAYGYRRLMERQRMSQADIAQAMSKGRSTIANALRLLELPEDAQQLLFEDKITAGHARAILSIPTKEGRESLTKKLRDTKMSVREAEATARLLANKPEKGSVKREPMPQSYKSIAKALRETLNTNVKVRSSKGKNKIEIDFKDEDDLRRIFDEMVSRVS